MLTISTVFTSLVALHALLASTGQVEASVLRRANTGHAGRQSHAIRGLLNVAGSDESFQRRQGSCDTGFFACPDGTGCCPNGQSCETLQDGTPVCCCSSGGNCASGYLPCSANVDFCCPKGDLCSSDGHCFPPGSGSGSGGATSIKKETATGAGIRVNGGQN